MVLKVVTGNELGFLKNIIEFRVGFVSDVVCWNFCLQTTVTFVGNVNNATVVTPDLLVCNSVVHVINRVLLPNATLSAIPIYNANTPTPGNCVNCNPSQILVVTLECSGNESITN